MTTLDNSEQYKHEMPSRPLRLGRELLILGILGFGLFQLSPWGGMRFVAEKPEYLVARQASAPQSLGTRQAPSGSAGSRPALEQPFPSETPADGSRATGRLLASAPLLQPAQRISELDALVAQLKNLRELTPEGVKDMKRQLQDVQKRGVDAVLAIRDFLRSQENVGFDRLNGGKLAEQQTLRQALFDSLRQIGGDEAIAVLLEQLGTNQVPAEIAMLARILEEMAPGVYRYEAIRTAANALSSLATTKDPLLVRPLFELLRELGGAEALAILEQFPANAVMVQYLRNKDTSLSPTVRMYALMALATLPDGQGISNLVALGADPNVPVEHRSADPFRMLAQASADQADAGAALLYLAGTGQIPDRAWAGVADALAGKLLQFPSQSADAGLSGVSRFSRGFYDEQRNLLYEERTVLGRWSEDQIQFQLALINNLLSVAKSPAAVQALQRALAALRNRR